MKRQSILFLQTLLFLSALLGATQLVSAASETWTGNTGANWSSPGNWSGPNTPPVAGDSLTFGTSGVGGATLTNDLTAGTAFSGLTFNGGSAFTLNGNGILLSGSTSNTIGIANSSGLTQTFGTMPLTNDWGYYTFSSSSGTLALNGGLALNTGGVSYFGPNVTSTTLTTDGSELIAGLGGAGLMYSAGIPTGLATISSRTISAYTYSGGNILATGAVIPSNPANNIELSASGATGSYTLAGGSGNTFASTITVSQAGGANNSDFTTTLTDAGTLVLGTNNAGVGPYIGGIYVLNSQGTNHADFTLNGGQLTAGPMSGTATPGAIVLAVNGNNPNNQMAMNSVIQDNGSGGPVTVITTGSGSLFFNTASTYSGGTYVNQGQLQLSGSSVGTGPIYVAAGASFYLLPGGTFANDFYLSPGLGAGPASAAANQGALNVNGSAPTLSGIIHLLGAAVPAGPGDRIAVTIAAGGTLTISGQITGTGTLDIAAAHSDYIQIGNTANDWSGGLVLGQIASGGNANCYFRVGTSSTSAGPIPHGSGKGNVMLNGPSAAVARFDLNGHNVTMNGLNSKGAYPTRELVGTFQGGSGTLTLGDGDANGTFYGVMSDHNISPGYSDVLNLIKIGAGTQTLSGINTNHGSMTVSNGTLALTGSAWPANSGGYFTVAAGAILDVTGLTTPATVGVGQTTKWLGTINGPVVAQGGTICCLGTINGSTVVNAVGVLSPTDHKAAGPLGTMTQNGSMTFGGGGAYTWYINSANGTAGTDTGWSLVKITGGLTIAATSVNPFTINLNSFTPADLAGSVSNFDNTATYAWSIAKTTAGITGFDPAKFVLNTAGFANSLGDGAFFITTNATDLILLFLHRPPVTGTGVAGQGTFTGAPNVTYTIQCTPNLNPPVTWQTLMTVTTDGAGSGSFMDASAPAGQPQRFYRVSYP